MSNLGLGVMIDLLSGNEESVEAFNKGVNKTITRLWLTEDALHFRFDDGTAIKLSDEGQSCCESRYMTSDDDLGAFAGSTLLSAEVQDAPSGESKYGEHEVQFLRVKTSMGTFTVEAHNEHNGYYGGFLIRAAEEPGEA